MSLTWRDALKKFNDERSADGGKYTIPKKGTPEYDRVKELQNAPLKTNITADASNRSKSKTPPKEKKPLEEQAEPAKAKAKVKKVESKIEDIPVETEAAPQPKSKESKANKKKDAGRPVIGDDGVLNFDV